ncbi:MAG: hypothetical protein NT069_01825 [Planctomycetota bacterium]|nr:hypothetical protein [Planctomycetota bacterium]
MISNIAHSDGQLAAAEVLDLLRSLRQQHADLRMVLTGSIGLHHVLAEIRAANIPSEPVNDMFPIDVPPLARADAESLARDLIAGETLNCPDPNAAAACIAEESDCFPFYIHHIVNRLRLDQLSAVPASIQDVVARQLVDANDPWELSHYNDRLMVYYKNPQDVLLARAILDALSYDTDPVPVNSLLPVLNSATPIGDRDQVLRMLKLLERDHYLTRDRNGAYQFRFPLVRRWWALERGL